jgi:site-specific recombinase XerD
MEDHEPEEIPALGAPHPALVDEYLLRLRAERNLSALTLRNYRTDLEHFFRWLEAEGIDPLALDRRAFRRYLVAVDAIGTARGSVARKVSTIHTFYRRLVQDGRLASDPLHGVRPPKQEWRLPKLLAKEQAAGLIEAPEGDGPGALRDRAVLELLYATGVRVSELAGLDTADLDLAEGTLRVTGKGNKQRVVVFGEPAARALRAYLRDARPRLTNGRAEAALFLNRDGGRLSVRAVQILVRRAGAAAGIQARTHPHLLRHSFATHMLDGGADVRVVQELLGHAKSTTTQIYTHVTEARQRQVYTDAFYNAWHPRGQPHPPSEAGPHSLKSAGSPQTSEGGPRDPRGGDHHGGAPLGLRGGPSPSPKAERGGEGSTHSPRPGEGARDPAEG